MSKQSNRLPGDTVIQQLQELLLKAVLMGEALPGTSQPIVFPDLAFVLDQPEIFVSDENLAGPIVVDGAPKPVRVLSPSAIAEYAREAAGNMTFLRFQPPQVTSDTVQLTLEAKIAPHESGQRSLGLSGTQVVFRKVGSRWQADESPTHFAA